ncbi:type I restriction endonuclease subunit R [Endozoicomonas sp. SCSIO W0465]|uniref:type I restriction endonuclease subunit R n=1 Tax=Endozoicomonas sp. SCSIO W0465 TaxID=2918516 RepID=UPI0020760421|nr:HsdR family type I site-specific deoxyribonuclease [Endozoicomonas sp. SCSIO W0465]USE38698.1 HsdR family type I site-specific deoxyribonuclease [Endozoicomonas sp. SCSIO W0465]
MAGSGTVTKPERATQNRVVKTLFQDQLGYHYLGDWEDRPNNSNVEETRLTGFLVGKGYNSAAISRAVTQLKAAASEQSKSLYQSNKAFYELLRFGVNVKTDAGNLTETVQVIDWHNPEDNDFAIAEEVTVFGEREKRPDVVLYVNGIAVAVLELKNSRESVGKAIRQSNTNQRDDFIRSFFNTVQFVFAGNDSEGLKYGTILTPEKFFLTWKEDEADNSGYKLDKYLGKLCEKRRFIELLYDFVLFDGGIKKLPRVHQYFGVKAAQEHIRRREGGIIWHTQGSGKSITMVLLAKWILENKPDARVLVITDRVELNDQIERVFTDAGEAISTTSSGRDLMAQLGQAKPRLICSLVHKFGRREVDDLDAYIKELGKQERHAVGDIYVFVDECHRTQSGSLHRLMKAILPGALFIGFTGTPLLKKDKATSLEVFGKYIHTYKFNEAVEDGVVLDLVYEARDIDQRLKSQGKVDEWFDAKTKPLNDYQKSELKKMWGTMQKVLSARSRMNVVVSDIILDFNTKQRLSSQSGNAILVASSIYEACRYYQIFQETELKGKCAVVTSYNPQTKDIATEGTGNNTETDKEFVFRVYEQLLKDVKPEAGKTKTETYESKAKSLFTKEPANMKLLIVVDKLLTGFDAPSCTYLYIDKSMQDHGLFQAICRVNRLDTEDKINGYIIDYKDLFNKVGKAVAVYTSELDYDDFKEEDCEILLKQRLEEGRERLDNALEAIEMLCEPVPPPRGDLEFIHYFCGNSEMAADLKAKEPLRAALYKSTVALIRAYANIADELVAAGYTAKRIEQIKERLDFYVKLRELIRRSSNEVIDLKAYEADMRHLIDTYIQADDSVEISPFKDTPLIDVIVRSGMAEAIRTELGRMKGNQQAVSEAIENNVRSRIIESQLNDPAYFDKMSTLLDELIRQRKQNAIEYEKYLKEIAELANKVVTGQKDDMPAALDTPAKRMLYNNLGEDEALVLKVDAAVRANLMDAWRGDEAKESYILNALYEILQDEDETFRVFNLISNQQEYLSGA